MSHATSPVAYARPVEAFAKIVLALMLAAAPQRGGRGGPPFQAKPEELAAVTAKSSQIEAVVNDLNTKHRDPDLIADVEVYAKAGRFLVEFPELVASQSAMDHAATVLDQGLERAHQLQDGSAPWTSGKKQIHAYYS